MVTGEAIKRLNAENAKEENTVIYELQITDTNFTN